MSEAEKKLQAMGITLPTPAAPVANYVPYVITGSLLIISGQIAFGSDGKIAPAHVGKIGGQVSAETGVAAAKQCAINLLAQAKAATGDLDKIVRCVRLGGFMNVAPGFSAIAPIMNGASDLIVEVLGDKGRHARSTVGVAELPLDSCVEVEAMFEIALS
jgi:enamine deaminase RidA (YjgF/YER057c/UK114 family)